MGKILSFARSQIRVFRRPSHDATISASGFWQQIIVLMSTPEYVEKVYDIEHTGDSISEGSESDYLRKWSKRLLTLGVESRGLPRHFLNLGIHIEVWSRYPTSSCWRAHRQAVQQDLLHLVLFQHQHSFVSVHIKSLDPRTYSISCRSFSAGTLGPVIFGLGLRDSCLVILFFNLLCCVLPAYLWDVWFFAWLKGVMTCLRTTWGPKLGMRQMIISRYSFGCVSLPLVPFMFS